MRFIVLAALFACALSAEHTPKWVLPRLPLPVLLSGKAVVYDANAPRIVGGVECKENELPFQLSLQRGSTASGFSQSCGGSILDAGVTINAAHCVRGVSDLSIWRLVAGEHSLRTESGKEQIRNVARYIMHENYGLLSFDNDISLIFPDRPFDLSVPEAKAITLPRQGSDPNEGTVVTVSGWGTLESGGSIPDKLRKVDVPIVSRDNCNAAYEGSITDNMICAGVANGGLDSCQGDSGGPLFTGNGQTEPFVQHGIVSWGQGCALAGYPGVYTRVGNFVDWIERNRG